jgi:hypothetical protein
MEEHPQEVLVRDERRLQKHAIALFVFEQLRHEVLPTLHPRL